MTHPILPADPKACLVTRVWRPDIGPAVVTLRAGEVVDISSRDIPTMRDLIEMDDPASAVRAASGETICDIDALLAASTPDAEANALRLLAPSDLQAVKACGVTFADSMVERVIEEKAAGDFKAADAIRTKIKARIGDSLSGIVPGSEKSKEIKAILQSEGLWSQYLEVGIGPDAEVFTKGQPLSSVGHGAAVGLHPISTWNNPEPEVVLAVSSRAQIKGATLGNDVNLRDVEGRSALLLGKAKDNNASCAIGPVIRLFDADFGLAEVETAELTLRVEGEDGFVLDGHSSMSRISRKPTDLVAQTCGAHHQYPDGFMLFLGTLFAPVQDRDTPGQGFTHKTGDVVTISEANLGALSNTVRRSPDCPPWTFGARALMANLAGRGLL